MNRRRVVNLSSMLAMALFCCVAGIKAPDAREKPDDNPSATFDVTEISPKPDAHVSEATTIKATLQFKIENFTGPPDKYNASLMFENPMGMSGNTTSLEDYGCKGSRQDLTAASGTVTLECHLSEVWQKFRHSKRMSIRFFIIRHRGSSGAPLARSQSIQYAIDR